MKRLLPLLFLLPLTACGSGVEHERLPDVCKALWQDGSLKPILGEAPPWMATDSEHELQSGKVVKVKDTEGPDHRVSCEWRPDQTPSGRQIRVDIDGYGWLGKRAGGEYQPADLTFTGARTCRVIAGDVFTAENPKALLLGAGTRLGNVVIEVWVQSRTELDPADLPAQLYADNPTFALLPAIARQFDEPAGSHGIPKDQPAPVCETPKRRKGLLSRG